MLIVEDDYSLELGLRLLFRKDGYETVFANTMKSAAETLRSGSFDAVVLDVQLPDGEGYQLIERMKRSQPGIPVLFLTARDDDLDLIKGFELGAADYITKPFKPFELLLRVKAALRLAGQPSRPQLLVSEPFVLDLEAYKLSREGKDIALTRTEFKLLKKLMANKNRVVTREALLESIWDADGNFVDESALTVNINRLRNKVEAGGDPRCLKTVRGIGYIWEGK